jgi:tetratricopeptide (TPR) repeat protein
VETAANEGIPALMIYLSLFIVLFWQLHKVKHLEKDADINAGSALMAHGLQAAFIAYLIAIFFSFDDFSTYLTFFVLAGYSMHLVHLNRQEENPEDGKEKKYEQIKGRGIIMAILSIALLIFLWQYNFLPLEINMEANRASALVRQKYCDQAFSLMDKILPTRTFLDSYLRMQYVEFERDCSAYHPKSAPAYAKKGLELINEAVKIQPLYARYWLGLGNFAITLADQEQDAKAQNDFIKQADFYFDKALELAPKRQEILIGKAKADIISGDYKSAEGLSRKCVAIDPGMADCYWYLGLSEICLKDKAEADKNIQAAEDKGYDINSQASLAEIGNAYGSIPDYNNLAITFEKLAEMNPGVAQYHSSLAFFYFNLKEYKKARQEALITLQLSPESKPNVDAFLKTLPY